MCFHNILALAKHPVAVIHVHVSGSHIFQEFLVVRFIFTLPNNLVHDKNGWLPPPVLIWVPMVWENHLSNPVCCSLWPCTAFIIWYQAHWGKLVTISKTVHGVWTSVRLLCSVCRTPPSGLLKLRWQSSFQTACSVDTMLCLSWNIAVTWLIITCATLTLSHLTFTRSVVWGRFLDFLSCNGEHVCAVISGALIVRCCRSSWRSGNVGTVPLVNVLHNVSQAKDAKISPYPWQSFESYKLC